MKSRIYTVLEVLFIALFIFSCYKLIGMISDYSKGDNIYKTSQEEFTEKTDPEKNVFGLDFKTDIQKLREENQDVIGWIYIEDTQINYPLLLDDNNDYYLKHTYNKIYSDFGSIFIDYRCTGNFEDANTIIYGHNTKNGSMFGSLKKYKAADYRDSHKYVYIITEEKAYKFEVVSAQTVTTDSDVYTLNFASEAEHIKWYETVLSKSEFSTDSAGFTDEDKTITLSTCTTGSESERFVVVAKLTDIENTEVENSD